MPSVRRNAIAAGAERCGDGSRVPGQSNSAWKPRSRPQEITGGWSVFWRSGDVHRNPLLRGTHSPLVEVGHVPVHAERGNVEREGAGRMRAVGENRDAARAAAFRDRRSGSTSALSDVMWSRTASLVLGVMAAANASTTSSADRTG